MFFDLSARFDLDRTWRGRLVSDQPFATGISMKRQRLSLPICLMAVAMMAGCDAETGANHDPGGDVTRSDSSMMSDAGGQPVSETAAESLASDIRFNDGKLSVSVVDVPLHRLATEVSNQSGVDIRLIGEYPGSSITAELADYPLDTGLKLLLRELNTIFIYAGADEDRDSNGQLVRVMILPDGEKSNLAAGMETADELVSRISEHLQISLPQSYNAANLDYPEIDPAMEQVLFELGENLNNQ